MNPLSEQTIAKPAPKHRLAPCLVLCAFLRCCPPLVHVELVGTWLYNMFGPARSTCPGDKPQLALSRRGKQADACEHPEKTPPPRYFDTKHKEMTGRWKAAEEEGGVRGADPFPKLHQSPANGKVNVHDKWQSCVKSVNWLCFV